jgi:hypothetical protein
MQRLSLSRVCRVAVLALCCAPRLAAQLWNDPRALALVRQATERREQQLADSGLVDYQALAHGYLTFLAQLGEGFREPPKVVKADELALQVYWRAPNLSKQVVVGRRDTTVLPTDIQYHRDHLGIVQNNFPNIIRLGEGDEVQDVPHPLSGAGLAEYDFALTDSLRITIPGRVINVYEVKVRPRDDRQPRIIGALYVDRDNGQVVRMAFSFTRAAYLDKELEDVFIVLENGLVGTRFWLPRHQEVEIRRTATWLDYPVRGIIRGRWEISDYELNTRVPVGRFAGPEIVFAPPTVQRSHEWSSARILDSLPPDVRAATAEEIRRVQIEARGLVREQALRRSRGSALAARGISDFLRFDRNEGVAIGGGLARQLGMGLSANALGRYGTADRQLKGGAALRYENGRGAGLQLAASDDYVDVGEVPERSTLVNSLAAQETGSDYTDFFRARRGAVALTAPAGSISWTLEVARERQTPLTLHASPASGRFERPAPADSITDWSAKLTVVRPTALWIGGLEMRARVTAGLFAVDRATQAPSTTTTVLRVSGDLEIERPIGDARVVARTVAASITSDGTVPAQQLVFMGGPVTAPGYDFHSLVGRSALSQRLELRFPAPFPAFSLGRFGRAPGTMMLAPFATAVALRRGAYPSAGVGALMFFDLLRVDAARGLRDGRWSFYLDLNRSFWSIL